MEFKKTFFMSYIVSIIMLILVTSAAIYAQDIVMGVVALILTGILVKWYIQYNEDEQEIDAWYNSLDLNTKKLIYKEYHNKEEDGAETNEN